MDEPEDLGSLVDEYGRLDEERKRIEKRQDEIKEALVALAQAREYGVVYGTQHAMRFRRWRSLEVRSRDAVLEVLGKRNLLSEFAVLNTKRLLELSERDPALRGELGVAVEEVERITPSLAKRDAGAGR